jgi:hypothetical protein
MIGILARRNLSLRPWRSALLLGGFGLGVGVMVVLLAIGEAMLTQARDERLVGGGDVTVLPEGIDVEVMKTGGVGGLFFSINNARFLDLQLLSSPRFSAETRAVAPQIADKVLYLRTADGRERAVRGPMDASEQFERLVSFPRAPPLSVRCRPSRRANGATMSSTRDGAPRAPPSFVPTSTTFIFHRATRRTARAGRNGTTSTCCRATGRGGRSSRSSSVATFRTVSGADRCC